MNSSKRIVHCGDAVEWLASAGVQNGFSLVTSLPDISEFPSYNLEAWQSWFVQTARSVIDVVPEDGVAIFFQSDIKWEGHWVDKGHLCQLAADATGASLLWHKIVCRAPAGTATFGRPSYSHLLCFSKKLTVDPARSTADVIANMGDKSWQRGMGLNACRIVARFIASETPSRGLINPFCGEGGILAAANEAGLDAIGIERSPKRAQKARQIIIQDDCFEFKTLPE
jgi:hypothetical protein